MFCQYCGNKLSDNAKFCPNCGKPVSQKNVQTTPLSRQSEPVRKQAQPVQKKARPRTEEWVTQPAGTTTPKKKKGPGFLIAIPLVLLAIIAIVAGVIAFKNADLSSQKKELTAQIDASEMDDYIEEEKDVLEDWNDLGFFSFQDKKDIIDDLEDIVDEIDDYANEKLEIYKNVDMSEAEDDEVQTYNDSMDKLEKIVSEKDYSDLTSVCSDMDDAVSLYIEPENPLNISVQQIDVSEYPTVRLYLNIEDPATGEIPDDLEQNFFFLRRENAKEKYVKETIKNVTQLNDEEALNIDMIADVSGSMDGTPLMEAKSAMTDFVNSVQFSSGDMVELISFATGVKLEEEFCNDAALLNSDISNLSTENMTALYDALYTGVERVASQSGAKCVIAFTDGNDNYSSCGVDEVIDIAQRYQVPIFIIGIGNIDYYDAQNIADSTGGAYFNITETSSMLDVYNEIYRAEKELYLLEYEDTSGNDLSDAVDLIVGYNTISYGGRCDYSYTPKVLINVNSTTLYTSGPEAVVERYIKGFDDAMSYSDFSYISDCLKKGSNIYDTQKDYVTQDISERLDSFEIVDVDYSSKTSCVVTTRENYYVQISGKPLKLMTQQCQYEVEKSGGEWLMTDFAGQVKVLSSINQ